ncbi:MAG: type II toxin-antitoxin system RelE/ParE family toxin [Candidatus Marinimicrobia bacterium]|nr:type II toxin-antitoxin system RelE/ParE family toxin [Candidatus Neomarinimicrobiota bacterium]
MASYKVEIVKSVEKRYLPNILAVIHALARDPFPANCRKLQSSKKSYRLRSGPYRILFEVDTDAGMVTVFRIRHRKDVYR